MSGIDAQRSKGIRKRKLSIEPMERRDLMASDWQNVSQKLDANHDLVVSPLDALIGINRLNLEGAGVLPVRAKGSQEPYYDTDGNGLQTPLDVLLIINALNLQKPLPAVRLQNDTGVGPEAQQDRNTTVAAIEGRVSNGKASSLLVKFSFESAWHDVTDWLEPNGSFHASSEQLESLLGSKFENGSYELQFRVLGHGEGEEGTGDGDLSYSFVIDTNPPYVDLIAPWVVSQGETLRLVFNERIDIGSLDSSKIKLALLPGDTESDAGGVVNISLQSIEVSDDGYALIIRPASNLLNGYYRLLLINDAIRDMAGNGKLTGNPNNSTYVYFNRFIPTETLQFGKSYAVNANEIDSPKDFAFEGVVGQQLAFDVNFSRSFQSSLSLYSPSGDRQSLQNGQNSVTLREAGQYILRAFAPLDYPIDFEVFSVSNAPDISSATEIQGEAKPFPGFYRLQAIPGEKWYFEDLGSTNASLTVFNPLTTSENERRQETASDFSLNFFSTGEVWLEGRGAHHYRIHRSPPSSQAYALGSWIDSSIAIPGQMQTYHFEASAGDLFLLEQDALGETMPPKISIFSPDGSVLETRYQGYRTWVAPSDGIYQLWISADGHTTPHFRFRVSLGSSSVPISFETPFGLGESNRASYRFELQSDQRIVFQSNSTDDQGRWYLLCRDATGYKQVLSEALSDSKLADLKAGNYLLILTGSISETGTPYTIHLPSISNTNLEVGDHSIHLNAGDVAQYRFSAKTGDRYLLNQAYSNQPLAVTVSSTDGNFHWDYANAPLPILIPVDGDYILRIETRNSKPADVGLTWTLLTETEAILPDTLVAGTIDPSKALAYRIQSINRRLFVHFEAPVADAHWIVYDPLLNPVAESLMTDDIDLVLPANSKFYLVLRQTVERPAASFSFRQVTPINASRQAFVGTPIQSQLNHLGDRITYTFDALAGQTLYFDNRTLGNALEFRWLNAQSDTIQAIDLSLGNQSWLIRETGKYSIQIQNRVDSVSKYDFELLDLARGELLTIDAVHSITIPNGSSQNVYRIQPTNTEQLSLDFQFHDGEKVFLDTVIDGRLYWRNTFDANNSSFGTLTLPISSRPIYLIFRRIDTAVAASHLDISVSRVANTISPRGFGQTFQGIVANERVLIPVNAPSGSWMQVDGMYSGILESASVTILDPNGELFYQGFTNSDSSLLYVYRAGIYRVQVTSSTQNSPSNYKFRLNSSTLALPIQLGEAIDNQGQPEMSVQLYRLELDHPTEIALKSSHTAFAQVLSAGTGKEMESEVDLEGLELYFLPAGTYWIALYRNSDVGTLKLESLEQAQSIELDQPTNVPSPDGEWTVVKFHVAPGETILAPRCVGAEFTGLLTPSRGFIWSSSFGTPDRLFSKPGEYRLLFKRLTFWQDPSVNVQVLRSTPILLGANIGTELNRLIALTGNSITFFVPVTAGQKIVFEPFQGNEFFDTQMTWMDSEGREVPFADGRLPVYENGTYRLRFTAREDNQRIRFRLVDLDQLPEVNPGMVEGTLPAAQYQTRWLLRGTPGDEIAFTSDGIGDPRFSVALVDELGKSTSLLPSTGKKLFQMPESGRAIVVLSRTKVSSELAYSFQLFETPHSATPLRFDQEVTGDFQYFGERRRYSFQGSQGDRVWIKSPDPLLDWVLVTPSGIKLNQGNNFTLFETGTYTISISHDRAVATSYQFQVNTAPDPILALPLGTSTEIVFEQPNALPDALYGKYLVTILSEIDPTNPTVFSLRDPYGNVQAVEKTFFVTRSTELTLTAHSREPLPSGTKLKVRVDPIEILNRTVAVGERIDASISLDHPQELWIEIPVVAGQWIQFDQLHSDPKVQIEFDFPYSSWRGQGSLTIPTHFISDQDGILRVHIFGQGAFGFRVAEIVNPLLVVSGTTLEGTIKSNEIRTWALDTTRDTSYVLSPTVPIGGKGEWLLVNGNGTVVRRSDWNSPITFTTSSNAKLRLVMIGEVDSTDSLDYRWNFRVR